MHALTKNQSLWIPHGQAGKDKISFYVIYTTFSLCSSLLPPPPPLNVSCIIIIFLGQMGNQLSKSPCLICVRDKKSVSLGANDYKVLRSNLRTRNLGQLFSLKEHSYSNSYMLFIFIEFIGVTLANKILQASRVQFYNSSPVYCIVCSPLKVQSPSITIYPPFFLSTCLYSPRQIYFKWKLQLLLLRFRDLKFFEIFIVLPSELMNMGKV